MITFIENKNDLKLLNDKELLLIPIINEQTHFIYEEITFLYILDIKTNEEFILNVNHQDYPIYDGVIDKIDAKLILTPYKKLLLYKNIISQNSIDLNFFIYPDKHKKFELTDYIPRSYFLFRNRFTNWETYPLSILIKMCQDSALDMMEYYNKYFSFIDEILKIDNLYYETLFLTETNAIEFDFELIYSNYNPYTLTNRPTNSSFGINLAALSKKDDTRKKLKSIHKNRKLIQFDYSSFHVYLLTKILNFELPTNTDIYMFLNQTYKFSTKESRDDIKMDFFKYIYGTKNYDTELFKIIDKFKQQLVDEYESKGYVTSFFLKRKIFFNSNNINQSNRLFNYYLQNAETEYNFIKLKDILNLLNGKMCQLLIYTYDSFLFDIEESNTELTAQIKATLERDNIPVTVQIGTTYGDLNDIY